MLVLCATVPAAETTPPRPQFSTPAGVETFVGRSSCTARGCHGGPDRQAVAGSLDQLAIIPAQLKNAATFWNHYDPHSRAYRTLLTARSRHIVQRWRGLSNEEAIKSPPHPEHETRCLACHTTPTLATATAHDQPSLVAFRSEGVSCDACHTTTGGDSRQWLDSHGRGGLQAAYAAGGLRRLETAEQRAAVCVGCHVGAAASPQDGLPTRDMNHDLIAAGHPRFLFDYQTYVERLPPHWQDEELDTSRELTASRDTTSIPKWNRVQNAIHGQRLVATAELALLRDRAQRAGESPSPSWPEFASLDCYACHHGLHGIDWRLSAVRATRPSLASWTGWLNGGPAQLALRGQLSPELQTQLTQLTRQVERFDSPDAVVTLAAQVHAQWQVAVQPQSNGSDAVLLTDAMPVWPVDHPGEWTWDEAARAYYLLATWERQTQWHVLPEQTESLQEIHQQLAGLYEKLRWPAHAERSPVRYAPEQLAEPYNRLRDRIVHWPMPPDSE